MKLNENCRVLLVALAKNNGSKLSNFYKYLGQDKSAIYKRLAGTLSIPPVEYQRFKFHIGQYLQIEEIGKYVYLRNKTSLDIEVKLDFKEYNKLLSEFPDVRKLVYDYLNLLNQ